MMDKAYFWSLVFCMSLGTIGIRSSFFFLYSRLEIPESLQKIFTYIPAAVLPALILPGVVYHQGSVDSILGKERLLALCVAVVICFVSKNVLLTIVCGMMSLYFLGSGLL